MYQLTHYARPFFHKQPPKRNLEQSISHLACFFDYIFNEKKSSTRPDATRPDPTRPRPRADDSPMKVWIGVRSVSKATYPGMWDQMVAGGQPAGMG